MKKTVNSIPYSQRFSNLVASSTNPNDLLQSQQGATSAKKTLTLQVNDRAMGNISYSIVSVPSMDSYKEQQNSSQSFKDRFSTVTSVALSVGTVVRVVATPSSQRYVLDHFEDVSGARLPSNSRQIDVVMNNTKTVRAVFREAVTHTQVELKVNWNESKGDVVCEPALSRAGTVVVDLGKTVMLTAIPKPGYELEEWNGTWVAGKEQPKHSLTITEQILSDRTITAVFADGHVPPPENKEESFFEDDEEPGGGETPGAGGGENSGAGGGETPGAGGGENSGAGGGGTPGAGGGETSGGLLAFAREWWWAIAIVAYIVYESGKGGKK